MEYVGMKTFRSFLTTPDLADSYVRVESSYGDVALKIADCSRAVYLTFSYGKPKHITTSLKKLAVLEKTLAMIRTELESKQ